MLSEPLRPSFTNLKTNKCWRFFNPLHVHCKRNKCPLLASQELQFSSNKTEKCLAWQSLRSHWERHAIKEINKVNYSVVTSMRIWTDQLLLYLFLFSPTPGQCSPPIGWGRRGWARRGGEWGRGVCHQSLCRERTPAQPGRLREGKAQRVVEARFLTVGKGVSIWKMGKLE